MWTSDFIEQSKQTDSPETILALLKRAANDLGFDRYAYFALTRHELYAASGNPAPFVAHNFPAIWLEFYFDHDCLSKDPVLLYTPQLEGAFLWGQLATRFRLNREQRAFLRQAEKAGLKDGVGVPLHGPQGSTCLLTFASSTGHPYPSGELRKIEALAAQFHTTYSVVGRVEIELPAIAIPSQRERQCLQWIAYGKTTWDISRILSISENTVNFHVKNAMRKLEANNRMAAVVTAIRYGLISLDSRMFPHLIR